VRLGEVSTGLFSLVQVTSDSAMVAQFMTGYVRLRQVEQVN
jgi:hypothetical protein